MLRLLCLALSLVGSFACARRPGTPTTTATPPASTAPAADPWAARLAALDRRIDAERERLGIVGMALVIVVDGEVIHTHGYGRRALDGAPVDADTLFAIGSNTKAFTAMLVAMAAEAGRLDPTASPRTCVPEFALHDPDADAKITILDLLTHTSGLMATDLAWFTGALSTGELIRLLAEVEPVAPLRSAYNYQNLMYVVAGECAARALGGSYEHELRTRILERIGMGGATLHVAEMQRAPDHAAGHHRGPDRRMRAVPMRDLDAVAAAGGINASVRMLGGWLQTLLGEGARGEQRLVAPATFALLLEPRVTVGPGLEYALGWLRSRWQGGWQYSHTGGIDGFSSLVAMLPEREIGFALVTNTDDSEIHGFVTHEVFALLEPASTTATQTAIADADLGTYGLLGGFKVELVQEAGRPHLVVAGQPHYPLEPAEGDRHRLGAPAPDGFFATVRTRDDGRRELLLEQPFGDLVLPRLTADELTTAARAVLGPELRALVGSYRAGDGSLEVELAANEGRLVLALAGQSPAPLEPRATDRFALAGLPDSFAVAITRVDGRVTGIVLHRPQGELALARVGSAEGGLAIDELLSRRARAHGSAALARHHSLRIDSTLRFVNQGLTGTSTTWRARGDRFAEDVHLRAFDREIGRVRAGVSGQAWESVSFLAPGPLDPSSARSLALEATWDPWSADRTRWASIESAGTGTLDGRSVIVVEFTTDWGAELRDSYDAKTYLLARRELTLPSGPSGAALHETRSYRDWRRHAGVMLPHEVVTESIQGKVIATVVRVAFDGATDGADFDGPADASRPLP